MQGDTITGMDLLEGFRRFSKEHARYLWVTGAILTGMFALMLIVTEGVFIYIQDDPYIHLQMARNFAEHATWGITPGTFVSASSSPLWVLLFSFFYLLIGKATLYLPLLLNIIAVFVLVILIVRLLDTFGIRGRHAALIVGFVALVTPLGPFAFSGMEHAFHMIAVLLFVHSLSKVLSEKSARTDYYLLFLMAPLVTALRYEGAFVIAVACLLILIRRKYLLFITIALLGLAPLILFAIFSVMQGGHIVPNTLLVKKNLALTLAQSLHTAAASAYLNIKTPLFMLFTTSMLGALYYAVRRSGTLWKRDSIALFVIAGAFVLQAVFGKLSWLAMFRYEAFLVLLGTLYTLVALRTLPYRTLYSKKILSTLNVALFVFLILLSLPLLRRAISWPYAILNARDLYHFQYQDARFMTEHYPNSTVGAIDIGMLSYFGQDKNVRVIDFWGLANTEVTDARVHGTYGSSTMRTIAQREEVRVAVLFDPWLGKVIPTDWPKVATWTLARNVSVGSSVISFYAPTCSDAVVLAERMRMFGPTLPSGVTLTMLDWKDNEACTNPANDI